MSVPQPHLDPPFPYDHPQDPIIVRPTQPDDLPQIAELSKRVYGSAWSLERLANHLRVFPQGQIVAVDRHSHEIVGMAASLIVYWDDYDMHTDWATLTDRGTFNNHDLERGRTLYGAEVMVDPRRQGQGIGKKIYAARRQVCRSLRLLRIRAGARLPRYHLVADQMTAEQYVARVVRRELGDPTLSFQLSQGFRVLAVVANYLPWDQQSRGYAAVIEWLNHEVARRSDYRDRDISFMPDIQKQRATLARKRQQPPAAETCPAAPMSTPDEEPHHGPTRAP